MCVGVGCHLSYLGRLRLRATCIGDDARYGGVCALKWHRGREVAKQLRAVLDAVPIS